jgi:hypothetical protein
VNVSCVERLVAGGAGDGRVCGVSAGGVVEDDWRALLAGCPAVAPGRDCEEDVAEFPALVREEVVVADGLVGVWAAFDDAVDETIERVMNTGGEVFFFAAGDLGVHQKIAAVLRR